MIAVELCHDGDPERPAKDVVDATLARCREQGVVILPCSPRGNVIRALPPLVMGDADLERGLDIIVDAIRTSCLETTAS
jgi:4-aminobutyrate aminotransferase-like enzyme